VAIGAIASGGIVVHEPRFEATSRAFARQFDDLADSQRRELTRAERLFRPGFPPLDLSGQTAILVDDGLATGSTMLAGIRAARQAGASLIVVAAPVASSDAVELIEAEADRVSILSVPMRLHAVGEFYENFDQVDDFEVKGLLAQHRRTA
jgi:predicted phosphoribosyltransferase